MQLRLLRLRSLIISGAKRLVLLDGVVEHLLPIHDVLEKRTVDRALRVSIRCHVTRIAPLDFPYQASVQ